MIDYADKFAEHKHSGQFRRDGKTPYISHPRAVRSILDESGIFDAITMQAALLHDTIEDTPTSHADLVAEFGAYVAGVVLEVTDDKSLPKQARKDEQIRHAPQLSDRAAAVKIADKIANMRDILYAPPPWPDKRKLEYFDHARAVVGAIGLRHEALLALFFGTYKDGIRQIHPF